LQLLEEIGSGARRVLVTPGMVELGTDQVTENVRLAAQAAEVATDILIVGLTNRRALVKGTEGGRASVMVVDSRPEAVEWVRANLGRGDVVLYENDLPDHYP
jgi:UDP-N-acetylmuramoyl-tripeptide--D-alanyl-D-alanine ligase